MGQSGKSREPVRVEGVVVTKETGMAILIEVQGKEAWIPKSQIDEDSEVKEEGDSGILIIPLWLADDKELDYEADE